MRFVKNRVKKLEDKIFGTKENWVVFTIGMFDNEVKREQEEERLINQCVETGAPRPSHIVWVNEIPALTKTPEVGRYLYSFSR